MTISPHERLLHVAALLRHTATLGMDRLNPLETALVFGRMAEVCSGQHVEFSPEMARAGETLAEGLAAWAAWSFAPEARGEVSPAVTP